MTPGLGPPCDVHRMVTDLRHMVAKDYL